jgi:hypothetical protein
MVLQVSTLKQIEAPEIWVAAGEGCISLEKFNYVLADLPSKGKAFYEKDITQIKVW